MSRRWALLLRAYLGVVSDGMTGTEALVEAAHRGGLGATKMYSDKVLAAKMEALLAHPDVKAAMRAVYAEVGFPVSEAFDLHVKHMRGGFVDGDGKTVPPNYAALRDFIKATTPQEPKRLQVLTARVPAPREMRDGSPPPMRARAIGDVIEGE